MRASSPRGRSACLAIAAAALAVALGFGVPWIAGGGLRRAPRRVRPVERVLVPAPRASRGSPPSLRPPSSTGGAASAEEPERGASGGGAAPPPAGVLAATAFRAPLPDELPCDGALDCVHDDPARYHGDVQARLARAGLAELMRQQGIGGEAARMLQQQLEANLEALGGAAAPD